MSLSLMKETCVRRCSNLADVITSPVLVILTPAMTDAAAAGNGNGGGGDIVTPAE